MTDTARARAEELLCSAYSKIEAEQITGNSQYIIDAMLQFAAEREAEVYAECEKVCRDENMRNARLAFLHPMHDSYKGATTAAYACADAIAKLMLREGK